MRVLVAMSGGVDSSVAAARLVADGHEVTGATLKLWGGASDTGCCSVSDVADARRVADRLGIDHHTFAYAEEFVAGVVDPYVAAHARGHTPNPCMACNREVKFGALLGRARRLGFDAVATGHHARVVTGADGVRRVARGADAAKDQSYVLAGLDHDRLGEVLFPVGDITKDVVRDEARRAGFATAAKPDSQDVCFITRTDGRARFLGGRTVLTPGRVVDTSGSAIGAVAAVETVTVGQRRGLGLPGGTDPRYVLDVRVDDAVVVVGTEADLRVEVQPVADAGWASAPIGDEVRWQVSAHGDARPGRLDDEAPGGPVVRWAAPQRRVAPGQALVAYDGDVVVGWAAAAPNPGRGRVAVEGYDATTYGERFADVYDEWYDDPTTTAAAVAGIVAVARAAAAGTDAPRLLELGVGTGRLALPLAAAGLAVTGLDASPAMLERLAAKPGAAAVTTVSGDMAGPLPDGPFDLAVVARNTFFNLTTEAAQRGCLTEVARVLAPGGRLVVEAFVPTDDAGPTSSVEVRRITADRVLLFVDRHDPDHGEAWSSFVDISADGIRLRPCHVRYLRPDDLDALAAASGLTLVERVEDWAGRPFDDASTHHVSTYEPR